MEEAFGVEKRLDPNRPSVRKGEKIEREEDDLYPERFFFLIEKFINAPSHTQLDFGTLPQGLRLEFRFLKICLKITVGLFRQLVETSL